MIIQKHRASFRPAITLRTRLCFSHEADYAVVTFPVSFGISWGHHNAKRGMSGYWKYLYRSSQNWRGDEV